MFITLSMDVTLVNEDVVSFNFVVTSLMDKNEKKRGLWKKEEMHAYCSYKKFEFEGILCHHALSVMIHLNKRYLSEHYILKQWKNGVTKVNSIDKDGVEIRSYSADSCIARHHYILGVFTPIFNEGCQSKEGFEILVNADAKLQMKLQNLNLDIP